MRFPSPSEWDNVYRVILAVAVLAGCWWMVDRLVVSMGASRTIGVAGLLIAAPAVAKLLAPVIFDGLAWGYRTTRWLALHHLQGQYYAYKSTPLDVLEGDDGFRWLRVASLRTILRNLPQDGTLRLMEPERTELDQSGKHLAMRCDAVLHWLNKAHTDENIRFKVWLERTVHNPSLAVRREKDRLAIRNPVV